jgi:hypothetical protein
MVVGGNKKVKQGTISILFGCHSFVHWILVVISWYKIYQRLPRFWEFCCILLHDIGLWNTDYLDGDNKRGHWELGALVAGKLFGRKGFLLVAGHCRDSGFPESALLKPDKMSWVIAPRLWLFSNLLAEPKIRNNAMSRWEHVNWFKEKVRQNIDGGQFADTHDIYLSQERR